MVLRQITTNAYNPLHTFPRNFPVDGLVSDMANKSATCHCNGIWKQHDTTDFCPRQLVTDLSFMLQTCCGLAMGKLPTCYGLAMGKLV